MSKPHLPGTLLFLIPSIWTFLFSVPAGCTERPPNTSGLSTSPESWANIRSDAKRCLHPFLSFSESLNLGSRRKSSHFCPTFTAVSTRNALKRNARIKALLTQRHKLQHKDLHAWSINAPCLYYQQLPYIFSKCETYCTRLQPKEKGTALPKSKNKDNF